MNISLRPRRQRGIATILIVLLAGLGLSIATFGIVYMVRSSQDTSLSLHAQTQAQTRAWRGVELLREYFKGLDETGLAALSAGDVDMSGVTGVTASIESASNDGAGTYTVQTLVIGTGAEATSTIRAVFKIVVTVNNDPDTSTDNGGVDSVINFNKNLSMSGAINVTQPTDSEDEFQVNVNGNLDTNGNSITGVDTVNSTGSVRLTSGSTFGTLNANCDVLIDGSVTVDNIYARNNICASAASNGKIMKANGSILITNSGDRGEMSALAYSGSCPSGATRYCDTMYNAYPFNGTFNGIGASNTLSATDVWTYGGVYDTNSTVVSGQMAADENISLMASTLNDVQTKGTLTIGNTSTVTTATVEGAVTLTGTTLGTLSAGSSVNFTGGGATNVTAVGDVSFPSYGSGISGVLLGGGNLTANGSMTIGQNVSPYTSKINGSVTKVSYANVYVQENAGITVSAPSATVPVLTEVPEVTLSTQTFDAYAVESEANYAFFYKDGYTQVTTHDVADITDGTYYLVNTCWNAGEGWCYPRYDYLCNSPTASAAVDCVGKIGRGYSDSNQLITYSSGTWTLSGSATQALAQGVAWFEGNVTMAAMFYNTIIATGNIVTSGSFVIYAPNYVGYDGTSGGVTYAPEGMCVNEYFPTFLPTQFCVNGAYDETADGGLGNYALLAGSVDPSDNTTYVGGNITLGASTVVYGSVMAGNQVQSSGATTVYGYVSALGEGSTTTNSLSGSTSIILDNLPSTYTASSTSPTSSSSSSDSTGSSTTTVTPTVLWTRYL